MPAAARVVFRLLLRLLRPWLAVLAGLALAWYALPWLVPLPERLRQPQQPSIRYLSRDGRPLRQLLTAEGDRVAQVLRPEELPARLVEATLAAEDKRFFSHGGLDLLAIARAAWDNARAGRIVSGASTLHQQLVKISAGRRGRRHLGVKLIEALQARRLAMQWRREDVLAAYLNRVSYGRLCTGAASAAQGFLGKPVGDLSVAECALLAALPQAPARHDPLRHPGAVRPRQRRILELMHAHGWLDGAALQTALAEPLRLQPFHGGFAAPHAVEMLRLAEAPVSGTVRTTLDGDLQQAVETILAGRLASLRDRHVTQAAVVVLENATGHVLALAGSRDFAAPDGGQINGAWAPHSPGSALKPFTYQLALERGLRPAEVIADLPVEYPTATGRYRPENYAQRCYGPVTCRDALGNSLNIAAVKVLADLGGAAPLWTRLRELGLSTLTEEAEHYGLGLTLGNASVRLLELANAYACLARLGLDRPWTLVPRPLPEQRRMDARACFVIADMLSDPQARLLTFGPHSPLRLPFPAAVKTGTSTNYRDNWCLGFTPEFTVGVWAGNFDGSPMQAVSGVTGAAPIWREVFLELQRRFRLSWYAAPAGLVRVRIDPRTGRRLTDALPQSAGREEWCLPDRLPPVAQAADYDARGRALLGPEYADWVRSADNWMGDRVACAPAAAPAGLRVIYPPPGTVILLDADLPGGGRRLHLQAEGEAEWRSPTLELRQEGGRWLALLVPGRHELLACDRRTGATQPTFIVVQPE